MDKLNILWTTTNKDTISHMISMYSINSLRRGLWNKVNIIVWGASVKLIGEDSEIQEAVKKMLENNVSIEGCLACSEEFGVTQKLKKLGINMRYMGEPLTNILKNNEKLLTL